MRVKKHPFHITMKNHKMTIPCWSLPALTTCHASTPMCRDRCYAKKTERLYKNVRPCRLLNLNASLKPTFVDDMVASIKKLGVTRFRIHEGGDFYSQSYLNKWLEICRQLPDVTFLTFTKAGKLFKWRRVPKNLVVFHSVWPDSNPILVPKRGLHAYTGDCPQIPVSTVECSGKCDSCLMCWGRPQNVHFKIH